MSLRPFIVLVIALITVALTSCGGNPRYVVASPRVDAPKPGKALVNFFYDYSSEKGQLIFNEKKELLFLVAPRTVHQVEVDPGEHTYFVGTHLGGMTFYIPGIEGKTKITAQEGRIYDVYLTVSLFGHYTVAWPAHPGTSYHNEVAPLLTTLQAVGPLDRTIPEIMKREEAYYPVLERFFKLIKNDPEIVEQIMEAQDSRAK